MAHVLEPFVMVKSGFGTKGDVSSAPCINFVRKMIWGGY